MEAATGRRATTSDVLANRRLYPRRRFTFPATFSVDGKTTLPAFGLDISGGGLRLFTQEPLKTGTRAFSLTAMFDRRKVAFRAVCRWSQAVEAAPGTRYRHGLQLRGIADGDWEFLMNLTLDGEAAARGVLTPGQLNAMLSFEKQHRIADALATAGRLSYNRGHRLPLIEYAFDGYTMRRSVPYYRFTVRSKMVRPSGLEEFRTPALVAIEAETVQLLD